MPYIQKPKKKPRRLTDRKRAASRYYAMPGYRATRASLFGRLPWCALCLSALTPRLTPAQEAHHLKPITGGRTDAERVSLTLDTRNIVPLCRGCHHLMHETRGMPGNTDYDFFYKLLERLHDGGDLETMISNRIIDNEK